MKLPFKTKKRKLQEECWSLDYHIVKWLNEHLHVYLKDKSDFVDMEYWKYSYKGKSYTEYEITDKLVKITDELLSDYDDSIVNHYEKVEKLVDEMYDILKLLHWLLWW